MVRCGTSCHEICDIHLILLYFSCLSYLTFFHTNGGFEKRLKSKPQWQREKKPQISYKITPFHWYDDIFFLFCTVKFLRMLSACSLTFSVQACVWERQQGSCYFNSFCDTAKKQDSNLLQHDATHCIPGSIPVICNVNTQLSLRHVTDFCYIAALLRHT